MALSCSNGSADGQFYAPSKLATDSNGNIWVVDNTRIQKFDPSGKFLLKIATQGTNDGEIRSPKDVATDLKGNIWILDNNDRLQKFTSNGKFLLSLSLKASTINNNYKYGKHLTIDSRNNLHIVFSDENELNFIIRKFNLNGSYVEISTPNVRFKDIAMSNNEQIYSATNQGILIYANGTQISPNSSYIKGRIYQDINTNCSFDQGDIPLPNIVVKTTPGDYYGITDSKGIYQILTDTGRYQVKQIIPNIITKVIQPTCPANNLSEVIILKNPGDSVTNVNFGNKVTLLPFLSSSVSSDRRRRCFTNNTIVSYSNSGYTSASDVKVFVKLPAHVILKSANKTYMIDKESNYVFSVGSLAANQLGSIHIIDSVACVADIRGLTACTKVWITPSNNYTLPADSPWDQSDITLSGKCIENGRIKLSILNSGQAMADSSEFRVFLDGKLALQKHFKLTLGDSLVLRVPANGKTLRLEADQTIGHPRKSQTNLTIEGCVATSSEIVSKGFVDILPQDDSEPEVSISCLPIVDSYDPNDKLVSPIGTASDHYTPTESDLKYTIRFQNTGSDTAYTVTVIDTLSDKLDMATLQLGATSHKYSFNVSGKGRPVLTFTFAKINLPDSTRNQLGSNGFVQFSIKPKAGLAEKARIENFADIVFDYNEPVRTNLTQNVLYDVPPIVDNSVKLNEKSILFLKPTIASFTPAKAGLGQQMSITGTNYQPVAADNVVRINGIQAQVVSATQTELMVIVPQNVTTGKVSVTTLGGTAVSEIDFVLGNEPIWSRSIRIYPNPSQGQFTIDLSQTNTRIESVEIYNHLGQKIVSQKVAKPTADYQVDLSDHGAGFYLVVLKAQNGNASRKIVIK